jgi:hypothetical protein
MFAKYAGPLLLMLLFYQATFAGKPLKKAEMDSVRKVAVLHRRTEADSIR